MQKECACLAESRSIEPPASAAWYCSCFLFVFFKFTLHVLYLSYFSSILTFYTAFIPLSFAFSSSDPSVQRAMEKVRKAINRYGLLNITRQTQSIYTTHIFKFKEQR